MPDDRLWSLSGPPNRVVPWLKRRAGFFPAEADCASFRVTIGAPVKAESFAPATALLLPLFKPTRGSSYSSCLAWPQQRIRASTRDVDTLAALARLFTTTGTNG